MEPDALRVLPVGRHLAIDEQGVGLRLTWRLERGFVNLSLWREDRCVETFHLDPPSAAELVSFLARGLADASCISSAPVHHLVEAPARIAWTDRARATASQHFAQIRVTLSEHLASAARRIRPS